MSSSSAFPCSCSGLTRSAPCYSLVEHGYSVRACVRDATRTDKTAHLLALNGNGVGSVEVVSADMTVPVSAAALFVGFRVGIPTRSCCAGSV